MAGITTHVLDNDHADPRFRVRRAAALSRADVVHAVELRDVSRILMRRVD